MRERCLRICLKEGGKGKQGLLYEMREEKECIREEEVEGRRGEMPVDL